MGSLWCKPPTGLHDTYLSSVLSLKQNYRRIFTVTRQSWNCALNIFLQYLIQQQFIYCYIKQCDLKGQSWKKEGKRPGLGQNLFRKTAAVEMSSWMQELQHFRSLHDSAHSFSYNFLMSAYLYEEKQENPKHDYPFTMSTALDQHQRDHKNQCRISKVARQI